MNGDPRIEVDLSVVIPMRDAAATVGAQLEALRAQEWSGSWEVLVADNGSDDESRALVAAVEVADPRFRLIDASGTPGPSAARNAGAARARGVSLAFCDADDIVGDGWLAAVGVALRDATAVTGPLEQHRLNPPWLRDVYGAAGGGAQDFAGIPFGPSANLGVRRAAFEDIGGFDESLSVGEDIELCLRLWAEGHRLEFVPEAVIHYRYRQNLTELFKQAFRYGQAGPMIVRRIERTAAPRPHRLRGLKSWVWLLRRAPQLRRKQVRARWLVVLGMATGRVVGSVRHLTIYL